MKVAPISGKKSGPSLTAWDRSLLDRHLPFYQQLASGNREPTTEAQQRFVWVLDGRAKPVTQHEIAYTRYLAAASDEREATEKIRLVGRMPAVQALELERAIRTIDEFELHNDQTGRFNKVFVGIKNGYLSGLSSIKDRTSQAALWAATLSGESEWTRQMERWSADQFNNLSNAYTKAMDAKYFEGVGDGLAHRILDGGHSLGGSWDAARNALQDDTFWQEFRGWGEAYLSDFSSVVGMPLTTLSVESLDYLANTLDSVGIDRGELVDLLSVNAVELVATIVPALGAIMNWSEPERKEFAKMLGASGLVAVVSANPALALFSIVCLGRAFHRARHAEDGLAEWTKSVATGGALSGIVLTMSTLVAGPVWVGTVSGILAILLLKRAGRSVDAGALVSSIRRGLIAASPLPQAASADGLISREAP